MTGASFIPKSAAKLTIGDYAMLKREDGRYVPLVFLSVVPQKRAVFYGGLLAVILTEPVIAQSGPELDVVEVALIDIDAFAEAGAPIVGNLRTRLDEAEINVRVDQMRLQSRVWGRRTPLKYANALAV